MPARHKRHSSSHYLLPRSAHRLRDITGRKHALFTGRGAAGIVAALRVFGLRDEVVLLPANTCYVVLWAVLRSGNKPLLVDVDSATGNLSADVLPQQTDAKAIIPCHMYGLGAPIEDICAWARERDVHVVEDAALALGATADGRPAGSWGDVSIFSFGLGKIADNQLGGVMLTDDDVLTKEIGRLLAEMPLWDDDLMALTNQWNAIYWALHQYEADNPQLPQLYPALYELYGGLTAYRLPSDAWDDLPELLNGLPANLEHRAKLAVRYDELLNLTPQPPLRQQRGSNAGTKSVSMDAAEAEGFNPVEVSTAGHAGTPERFAPISMGKRDTGRDPLVSFTANHDCRPYTRCLTATHTECRQVRRSHHQPAA